MINDKVKKNLLDLQYNKYLQYINTCVILLFTYFIGVILAFITKQVKYDSLNQLMIVGIVSIAVISFIVLLLLRFRQHIHNILDELKRLNI